MKKEILSKQNSNGIKRYVTRSKTWRAVDLHKMVGEKAEVKILKASKQTYWYAKKKGETFKAELVEEGIFASKYGMAWGMKRQGSHHINRWIQIKDAKIIKWL